MFSACGKSEPVGPRVPTRLDFVTGNSQVGPVGGTLPVKVGIKASDANGGVSGVVITLSTESQGGGSTAPTRATTGETGIAEVLWTLGGKVGPQVLTASATAVNSVTATATATPGAGTVLLATSNQFQLTVVGRAVSAVPSVRVTDGFGNPIAGVTVTFETVLPGSVITGAVRVSDQSGDATLGSWSIGPQAAGYTVRAVLASGAVALFEARGVPATVSMVAGTGQSANAGTAIIPGPAVRAARDDGSPLGNVPVTFVVTGGNGTIQGGEILTGLDGIARATRWILGTTPGANRLEAQVLGHDPIGFNATGVAGAAAVVSAASPATQGAFFGNFVKTTPVVAVTDAGGNPVAGTAVTFAITQGDGQLTGAIQTTDFQGRAGAGAWRLGSAVSHSMTVTAGAFAPLTFNATGSAPPAGTFKIDVRFLTTPSEPQRAAFDQAATRWKQLLLSGEVPYAVNEPPGTCGAGVPALNETVDGVVIFASLVAIDGVGNILGSAGPCIVRDDPFYQTAIGVMQFDIADLSSLETTGRLNDVILHEMGHVLGFGTMWNFNPFPGVTVPNTFLTGAGSSDPVFNGPAARAAFLAAVAPGRTFTGVPIPVENSFGPGTRDSHWRESTVTNELMTGFLNSGSNPLSAFTAAQFRDLGYVVNDALADVFSFQALLRAGPEGAPLQLNERPLTQPIIVINQRGRTVARVPRT